MRPRTFVDIYDRIKRLAKKTEEDAAQVRGRLDSVERAVTTQVERLESSVRKDVEKLNKSLTGEIRELVGAVKDGEGERRRMNERLAQDGAATAAALASLLEQVESQGHRIEQLTTIDRLNWKDRERIAQWDSIDREAVVRHVNRAIAEAPLEQDPCPHFVVREFFPRWFYDMVIAALPAPVFFPDRRPNKQQMRVPFPVAPRYSRLVWQYVADLVDEVCGPAIIKRLEPDIEGYVRSFCPPAPLGNAPNAVRYKTSDGRIMLRRAGYEILPHRDPKWGFVTALVYLARPGDPAEYGTELYRVRQDSEAPSENPFYVDQSQCELVRKVPFEANSVLVFLNSRGAHGASVPADAPETLERYLYQFRVGPESDSIRTLIGLMTDEAKAKWTGGKMNKVLEAY